VSSFFFTNPFASLKTKTDLTTTFEIIVSNNALFLFFFRSTQMIGVGIDLVFIPRVARLFNKYGIRFAKKFLHPEELKHFHEQKSDVSLSHYLASR
jgi:hypothetical protein